MRLGGSTVPIRQLSASAISMLATCPEQFRLRKIVRLPESRGVDKWIGSIDHQTHEMNFRYKIAAGNDLTMDVMNRTYDKMWDKEISEEGEPEWGTSVPQEVHDHGLQMIAVYHENVSPTIHPIYVEERFEEKVQGVPVPVVGYPDIEEKLRIVERKTTKTKQSKPKPQWLIQGRIYNLVLDKPVEWTVVTKNKTPTVLTPETEPLLRLDKFDKDNTVLLIQHAWATLSDLWVRYGPDRPWPLNGLASPFGCITCGFGPKYASSCVAWKTSE